MTHSPRIQCTVYIELLSTQWAEDVKLVKNGWNTSNPKLLHDLDLSQEVELAISSDENDNFGIQCTRQLTINVSGLNKSRFLSNI